MVGQNRCRVVHAEVQMKLQTRCRAGLVVQKCSDAEVQRWRYGGAEEVRR